MTMKRWTVVIERSVARELERLPKDIIELFVQFRKVLKRSHRVIFQVIDPTIIVIAVVHRKDAYE